MLLRLAVLMCVWIALLTTKPAIADDARALFERSRSSVVQVLIIEAASDRKSAIGSGFAIAQTGLVGTNFHVVAEAVHEPERYRVELLLDGGEQVAARLEHFDVVHDLALLSSDAFEPADDAAAVGLSIAAGVLTKGEPVYAMGNPFDLGQTIVPGTFNGLLETSFYQKQLFSGSLNPGMSGGPALSADGEVVGVNVATSGNQISFLVPVKYLSALIERRRSGEPLPAEGYQAEIGRQLVADQDYKFATLLAADWPSQTLGNARVGTDLGDYFKCWGDTQDDEDMLFSLTDSFCSSQDNIFISSSFQTGAIDYQYTWAESEALIDLRFKRMLADRASSMYTRNRATDEDVTNYSCTQRFVGEAGTMDGMWRTVYCVRRYVRYPDLFDVLYLGALIDRSRQGLTSHFALSGVSEANAQRFLERFLSLQSWAS